MTVAPTRKELIRKLALPIGGGGIVGFLASFGFLRMTDFKSGLEMSVSHEIAGLVGLLYMLISLAVSFGVFMPNAGARILNVEDADELREQKKQLTLSSLGTVALGAALLVLALSGKSLPIDPLIGAFAAFGLVVVAVITTLAMARYTDELQRSLSRDAIVSAFYLLFAIGGCWSVLAHTGIFPQANPLDWLTLFATMPLVGVFWQVGKRGLLLRGPN